MVLCSLHLINIGVDDFSFLVGTRVEEETSTLTSVGVLNRNNCYPATPIPLSPKFGYPLSIGVNDFAFFVGTKVEEETKQLRVVHGERNSTMISCCTYPYLAKISLSPLVHYTYPYLT
jgi:hypothetical protein